MHGGIQVIRNNNDETWHIPKLQRKSSLRSSSCLPTAAHGPVSMIRTLWRGISKFCFYWEAQIFLLCSDGSVLKKSWRTIRVIFHLFFFFLSSMPQAREVKWVLRGKTASGAGLKINPYPMSGAVYNLLSPGKLSLSATWLPASSRKSA